MTGIVWSDEVMAYAQGAKEDLLGARMWIEVDKVNVVIFVYNL